MTASAMRLSLGPISYFWERERVLDFYREAAASTAEIVYLGEIVCSKRRQLTLDDYFEVGESLRQAGKEVVLSSLTLLEAASELGALKRLCANDAFTVEANDVSAVQLLSAAGREFVTGPSVNIYNLRTLRLLARRGMRRWVLPVELGLATLEELQGGRPEGVQTEVFAFGRLPLAWSARCYTARSFNLPKDDCRFKCIEFPDGRLLQTREGEDFLVLNGIQTQSARTHEALELLPRFRELGVDVLRISPQSEHTFQVVELFDRARQHACPDAGLESLREQLLTLLPAGACNGYLLGRPGMDHDVQQTA
jgi:O2-independent ubiquinone biosynthesis protein UbiV